MGAGEGANRVRIRGGDDQPERRRCSEGDPVARRTPRASSPSCRCRSTLALDSDVVYHEYGHGLGSGGMIGHMMGPLAGGIGEGNSDGIAMLINGDDVVGEYSVSSPGGIRRAPYAGYPLTYGDVDGGEVHNDGEIYAAIVWRMIELFERSSEQPVHLRGRRHELHAIEAGVREHA